MNGVNSRTTIDEYHSMLDRLTEEMSEDGVSFEEVYMAPSWVKREIQNDRMALTHRNISVVLSDPIGILRKGFKKAW